MRRCLLLGLLLFASPADAQTADTVTILDAIFGDARQEAALFNVFHLVNGKEARASVPRGSTREQCASAFAATLRATGENTVTLVGHHVRFPDRFDIEVSGKGCGYINDVPVYENVSDSFRMFVRNSATSGTVTDVKRKYIPSHCEYRRFHTRRYTANRPNGSKKTVNSNKVTSKGWAYHVRPERTGERVTSIVASGSAEPRGYFMGFLTPRSWVGVEVTVYMRCIKPD